ncbi:uncharacterized protein LOC124275868 [Haliotis rubra]|uniref:uncharacterized protein LOC124275868 n=1 Tax=Haliotis rubra TaxID=36100 RepID=UPI001EE632BB|nr:uncharacterized protein LOC124275868 [Haliotis rubra]
MAMSKRTFFAVFLTLISFIRYTAFSSYFKLTISWEMLHTPKVRQGPDRRVKTQSLQVTYNIDERTHKILSQSIDDPSLIQPEITVVTAYFNIGSFAKGSSANTFTPGKYMHWMKVFGNIRNNLVAYTDSKDVYDLFMNLRRKFPSNTTKVFLIDRHNLWSFSLAEEIRSIYKQPNYPRHRPNTNQRELLMCNAC